MKKNTCRYLLPDVFSLLIAFFFMTTNLPSYGTEKADYERFEKIYSTLQVETTEKKKIKLNNLTSSVVIVNFWASWCIPCLEEIPSLIKLSEKAPKNELTVVMINTDEEDQLKNISKTKKKLNIPDSFLIVPDKKFKIADEFKFSAIPVTVIYKKGMVVYFKNGPVDFLKVPADFW